MKNLDAYTAEAATHTLDCTHAIGNRFYQYRMNCTLIGQTKSGKAKIILFGERNWKDMQHKKRISYVENYRLKTK